MANPWLKKNPFMSMWLSGVNAAAGSLRGHAMGQAKRQAASTVTQATNDMIGAWTAALRPPAKTTKRRKR